MNQKVLNNKIKKIKNKKELIKLMGDSCQICGEINFIKLCFHHINESEKDFDISDALSLSFSKLLNESKKCQLLCQNCHRELHFNMNSGYIDFRIDKKIYLEYGGGCCKECGYNKCPASLTFHHRNPNEKKFWIGGLCERINSIDELSNRIKEEINKCDILCANCHVVKHFDNEFYLKNKEFIENYKIKKVCKKVDREVVMDMHYKGFKNKDIAFELGCARSTISDIIRFRK